MSKKERDTDNKSSPQGNQNPRGRTNPKRWAIIGAFIVGTALVIGSLAYICFCTPYIEHAKQTEVFIAGVLDTLILVAIIVHAVIFNQQREAMREGLTHTDTLIKQNKEMITAVTLQSEHAKTQAALMDKQLTAMRETAEQADKHFGIAQRAYVLIHDASFPKEFQKQGDNLVKVIIFNGGRTPAMDITITAHSLLTEKDFKDIDATTIHTRYRSDGLALLVPEKPETITTAKFITIDEVRYLDWYEGRKNLFIQIAVNYTDIQDVQRVTYYWYEFRRVRGLFDVRYSKIGTYAKLGSGKLFSKLRET